MRIENNANASLQGLSANFVRLQKQRAAARNAAAPQAAQPFAAQALRAKPAVVASAPAPAAQVSQPAVNPAKADTVQISPAAANAQKAAEQAPQRPTLTAVTDLVKSDTVPTTKLDPTIAGNASTPAFTAKDVEVLQSSFGASKGDEKFNAAYDLDGNGTLNTMDLVRLLGRIG